MTAPIPAIAATLRRLRDAVDELAREIIPLELPGVAGREWYELLRTKLIPQLDEDAFLIVAVVGGTNIGKSVVFNHLVGCRASATSPLASGTKHPTCLVPEGFDEVHDLRALFPGFEVRPWNDPSDALQERDADYLFWRSEPVLPSTLVVLDTPDIDSEARINWHRADGIRRSADVLVAVLTQQKYNDAAVKDFFRKAAAEDKASVIVINQVQLPEDEPYWPLWVGTFCAATGLVPEHVYLGPYDRRAAEENRLPFFERACPTSGGPTSGGATSAGAAGVADTARARNLLEDLSRLRFGEIKLRTLQGSLDCLLDEQQGLPAYLDEVDQRGAAFRAACDLLSAHRLAEIDAWPEVPNSLLVAEIRQWWAAQREGWTARVHGFYNAVGRGITWPIRAVREHWQPDPLTPSERYRQREWPVILEAIEKVYARLTWFTELGNPLLQPHLEAVLSGTSRAELLRAVEESHRQFNLQAALRELVHRELGSFREEHPQSYELFRRIDAAAAAVRPATSVVLFVTGFGPAGQAVSPVLADTAMQTVMHLAGDIAQGTVAAAVGETTLSGTASSGLGYLEARFRRLHAAFTAHRAAWLAGLLQEHLLGKLPETLERAAAAASGPQRRRVETCLTELRAALSSSSRRDRVPHEH
jgi:hypothetical protein